MASRKSKRVPGSRSRETARRARGPASRPPAARRAGGAAPRRASAKRASGRPTSTKRRRATARRTRPAAPSRARTRRPGRATPGSRRPAAPGVPSGIGLVVQHLDYTSQDLESIKRFYVDALGFTEFVHAPEIDYLTVRTGPSSSLGFMPPAPGPPEEWRPPREPALYLIVTDVDRAFRELTARDIVFDQPPRNMPWNHRIALLRDPEGRRVCLAQILEPKR